MSAQGALSGEAREASGVTSRLLLCYLERVGGREAIDEVLARTGLTEAEAALWDENTWFSFETKIRLFELNASLYDTNQARNNSFGQPVSQIYANFRNFDVEGLAK